MKISPMSASTNTAPAPEGQANQPTMSQQIRAIKMKTNANPRDYSQPDIEVPAAETAVDEVQSSQEINATVEASQPISAQAAALARERRALQVMRKELEQQKSAISTNTAESISKADLIAKPLDILLEAGVTYDQLTEAILAKQSNPQISALEAKIKALEEGVDQRLSKRDQDAEQQVLAELRREADAIAKENDDFELVREMGKVPDVVRLIERMYRESNGQTLLDTREAMQMVEDELFKDAQRVANFKKLQAQLTQTAPQQPVQQAQGMRTLTNRDTASVPMDRLARARAAFNGTLRK